jgi:hypothetical protein
MMFKFGHNAKAVLAVLLVSAALGVSGCAESDPQLAMNESCAKVASLQPDVVACGPMYSGDDRGTSQNADAGVYYRP